MAAYRGLLRACRVVAPTRRAVGAASHLPRQRRPPGEPVRRRRDQRPDPLGDLPGVDVLVALGAGPRLGDRLPPGVLPRRAGALRPHLPGLELGAPRRPPIEPRSWSGPRSTGASPATSPPAAPCSGSAQQTLYRIVLSRRPEPKRWVVAVRLRWRRPRATRRRCPTRRPCRGRRRPPSARTTTSRTSSTPSGSALRCRTRRACGREGTPDDGAAQAEKVAYFADRLGVAGGRLLDVGCGWAAQLRPMVEQHGVARGRRPDVERRPGRLGQRASGAAAPRCGWRAGSTTTRPSGTTRSCPSAPSSTSPGTARRATPGSAPTAPSSPGASAGCRRAVASGWRRSPTTTRRTPARRSGAGRSATSCSASTRSRSRPTCARSCSASSRTSSSASCGPTGGTSAAPSTRWLAALVAHRAEAEAAVGAATYRRFKTYLAASEVQFRLRAITNYRLVLERRPSVRR